MNRTEGGGMTRLEEIKAYWKENYGSAIANGDVDFLLAALAEKEKEIEGLRKQIKTIEAYNTGT